MLYISCSFIFQETLLPLFQELGDQRRHTCLVPELHNGREQSLEIEYDSRRERETTKGLPVHAQIAVFQFEVRVLVFRPWGVEVVFGLP